MSDNNEFLKQMENLQVPDINPVHQNKVKMAIMNAERSAALGVWLIIVPCYFFLCILMYCYSHASANWFGAMFSLLINSMDKTPNIDFLAPLILLVLPVICIIINVLAILHVQYLKKPNQSRVSELNITIKLRLWNILLILISVLILLAMVSFAMTENISVKY